MKVLHAALMLKPVSGIMNQMKWEAAAAQELSLPWRTVIFSPLQSSEGEGFVECARKQYGSDRRFLSKAKEYVEFRREYYEWLGRESEKFDVLVLRHSASDPFQADFIRKTAKPVYLVHHTKVISELLSYGGLGSLLRAAIEKISSYFSQRFSAGFIGVTNEIIDAGCPPSYRSKASFCYPNGVHYSAIAGTRERKTNEVPVIVFAASYFSSWHGLDLLLDSLSTSAGRFALHLVGDMSSQDLSQAKCDSRVVIHGHISQAELKRLLDQADVGLSSFALHRKSMRQACTLKTREYLAAGVPVYAGHRDVFPESFAFYKEGPPKIEEIVDFCKKNQGISRSTIASEARPFIEKAELLQKLYQWLKNRHGSDGK